MAIHLGRALRRTSCNQPGRLVRKPTENGFPLPRRPYSVLLPVGFTVPSLLPRTRCALTAPFHPYPACKSETSGRMFRKPRHKADLLAGRFAFCGTVPGVAPAGGYPAPCFHGARTFLSAVLRETGGEAAIRPADKGNKGLCPSRVKGAANPWLTHRRPLHMS